MPWLRAECGAELHGVAELRRVAAEWCALPPAQTEQTALAALSRTVVADAVGRTLADIAARGGRRGQGVNGTRFYSNQVFKTRF